MDKKLPSSAKVVIIGGGIVGCSTAYHLAKLGWTDTVLLERKKLTSGTTFHAAGLVGQLRTNANITQLLGYSVDLYQQLETETGLSTGWKMNGGLRLACNQDRWTEVKRQATTAHSFNLTMDLLTPKEAQALWPLMDISDLVGAAFMPTDGQANPSDITQALAKGARMAGASIFEDTDVLDINIEKGRIKSVVTSNGVIECERVVCCAGQWSREFAKRFGVNIPLVSMQHQYLVTEAIEGVTSDLPTLRDPDRLTYYKEEVGGLVMGGYEPNPKPWAVDGIPADFHFSLLDSDYDHFENIMQLSLGRVPALADAGVKTLVNGPESFTPDGNFIIGEAPELDNFYVGAGFNAFGIAAGGGAGMALASWVKDGEPPFDLWAADIRRFGAPHQDTTWVRNRTIEAYGKHYTMAWPHEENISVRPCRRSPLYSVLKAQGACFGEKLGWERPNWFADIAAGEAAEDTLTFGKPNWFEANRREHTAIRESAVLIDQSSFAKYVLKGPDACVQLNQIAANDVDRAIGAVIYTQMLNQRGGIECDLTITRISEQEFYIVTGTGFATHDYHWINKHLSNLANCQLIDVTSAYAVLSLMGPNAPSILEGVCVEDISNDALKFATSKRIGIAGATVLAMRISYVGELGWELHIPVEYAHSVYEALSGSGSEFGLINAGYRAIESCRLEKGYLAWGADIGPDHTPVEAGLLWAADPARKEHFIGRDALLKQIENGVTKKLVRFTVDDPEVILFGRETIYRDGERVGWLSSAGFGHTLDKAIGFGYVRNADGVDNDYIESGSYEIEVENQRVSCRILD